MADEKGAVLGHEVHPPVCVCSEYVLMKSVCVCVCVRLCVCMCVCRWATQSGLTAVVMRRPLASRYGICMFEGGQ